MRPVWWRHPWLSSIFVLALVLAAGLAGRALMLVLDWPPGAPPVEGWMTPSFVVHSYHVDPDALARILSTHPGEGLHDTLAEIAAARGIPVADLTAAVQALVTAPGAAR